MRQSTAVLCITLIILYASNRPTDGAGGIMFSGCPSLCACGAECARAKARSDGHAVNSYLDL